jgi:hypothetical protein
MFKMKRIRLIGGVRMKYKQIRQKKAVIIDEVYSDDLDKNLLEILLKNEIRNSYTIPENKSGAEERSKPSVVIECGNCGNCRILTNKRG